MRRAESATSRDPRLVLVVDVLHVAQPVVRKADAAVLERRTHPAAPVVAAHDDVLHFEHIDGELHHGKAVEVAVHDHVGDVAVDKEVAGQETDDLVGRHAAVSAADPQVVGRLLARKAREEIGIAAAQALRPRAIVVEERL